MTGVGGGVGLDVASRSHVRRAAPTVSAATFASVMCEARRWLRDNGVPPERLTNVRAQTEAVNRMSDGEVAREVARLYGGGLRRFVVDTLGGGQLAESVYGALAGL